MSVLETCMDRLSTAVERFTVFVWSSGSGQLTLTFFQLANNLHDSHLLQELLTRLRKMSSKVEDVHKHVKHTASEVKDVHKYVKHTASKVEDIHKMLKTERSGMMLARQEMPLKPEIFHGRDNLVKGIAQLLRQGETSRVCILGPGGMGKTSVSLAVVESPLIKQRFPGGNIIWVPCIEATSATLFLEILYTQLQVPGDKQVTLDKIISELTAHKEPRLILLDNFETPWNAPNGGSQKQVSDILRKLATLSHVAILVTMRGRYPPCDTIKWQSQTIQPTDAAACRRIFHDINPSSNLKDPDVDRLLAALGHMPFAVTLMANLGKRGRSTPKELLETWDTSGTDMLSATSLREKNMNQSISLSVDSEFVKQDPGALLLLGILSLLPAGTTKENLRWWATAVKMIPSAIATLSDAGLLVENKRENSDSPVFFVVPVVQSFMQQQGRITEDIRKQIHSSCCQYVLDHACRFDDLKFPKNSKVLAAEDTNIQSILFGSPPPPLIIPSDKTMEALIAFGWHRCDTMPNLEIANHVVTAAKASVVKRFIALALWCLGQTYVQLGDYDPPYNHLKKAYRLFNTIPLSEVESQRLGCQCGIDLMDTARFVLRDHDEIVSLARDVETKCASLSDDIIHGRCLVLLGAVHRRQQPHEALRCLDQAQTMLKAAGNTYNLANAYQIISWVHYDGGRFPAALDAAEKAWKLAELVHNPLFTAQISLDLGMVLFSINRDTEAWEHIEIALKNASFTGDRFIVAQALEYKGYGYLRRGDYQNAHGSYEDAVEKYLGTTHTTAYGSKRCEKNMARIKQKEENPNADIGFYRHDLDIDDTLFYPPAQANASNQLVSGS